LIEFENEINKFKNLQIPYNIETSIGTFEIKDSLLNKSFVGFFNTSFSVPTEIIVDKIKNDVIKKAKKRCGWNDIHKDKMFIIALDFENIVIDSDYLINALIGNFETWILEIDGEISNAYKKGWKNFLENMYVFPSVRFLDTKKRGIYFTNKIVKNVSAVIGMFRANRKPIIIPNPFSYEEINNPKLVDYLG
jgi:hypothetical protein